MSTALTSAIFPAIEADESQRSLLTNCLEQSLDSIRDQLKTIEGLVAEDIVANISALMKQVSDIPRLYRRTNKEVSYRSNVMTFSLFLVDCM